MRWLIASMVTELMTPLMPGAGPPPTTRANLPPPGSVAMKTTSLHVRATGARADVLNLLGGRFSPSPCQSRERCSSFLDTNSRSPGREAAAAAESPSLPGGARDPASLPTDSGCEEPIQGFGESRGGCVAARGLLLQAL